MSSLVPNNLDTDNFIRERFAREEMHEHYDALDAIMSLRDASAYQEKLEEYIRNSDDVVMPILVSWAESARIQQVDLFPVIIEQLRDNSEWVGSYAIDAAIAISSVYTNSLQTAIDSGALGAIEKAFFEQRLCPYHYGQSVLKITGELPIGVPQKPEITIQKRSTES